MNTEKGTPAEENANAASSTSQDNMTPPAEKKAPAKAPTQKAAQPGAPQAAKADADTAQKLPAPKGKAPEAAKEKEPTGKAPAASAPKDAPASAPAASAPKDAPTSAPASAPAGKAPKEKKAKKSDATETLLPPPPLTPEEAWLEHRSDVRRKWAHRRRVRGRHRRARRFFFGLFVFLLGVAVAYGALFAAAYFAYSGLTIDNMQRFGIAKDADKYLTRNGEVDLTTLSPREIYKEIQQIKKNKQTYTLAMIFERYGIEFPEEMQRLLPTDLFSVPLSQLASSNAIKAVQENLTIGYHFTLSPP